MNIRFRRFAAALGCTAAAAIPLASTSDVAVAQEVRAVSSYAAKFVCRRYNDTQGAIPVVRGEYRTVVNVHNPHDFPVEFRKKAVVALGQGQSRGPISAFMNEELGPDEAIGVNCQDISKLFSPPLWIPMEGFLVVRVYPDQAGFIPELDIVSVYTARDTNGQVSTIDVEEVHPRVAYLTYPSMPDLTIEIIGTPSGSCPTGQGSCVFDQKIRVNNIGDVGAPGPIEVKVDMTGVGLSTTLFVAPTGLAAGAFVDGIATLGPGNNCYNPDCEVDAEVDPNSAIPESDETNNKDSATFLG